MITISHNEEVKFYDNIFDINSHICRNYSDLVVLRINNCSDSC